DRHRRHAVLTVAPRDVPGLVVLDDLRTEIELARTIHELRPPGQQSQSLKFLAEPRRKDGLAEPMNAGEADPPRVLDQLGTRMAEEGVDRWRRESGTIAIARGAAQLPDARQNAPGRIEVTRAACSCHASSIPARKGARAGGLWHRPGKGDRCSGCIPSRLRGGFLRWTPNTRGWKKRGPRQQRGASGGRISPSGSGGPCARTTATTAMHGTTSAMTRRAP